MNAHYRTAPINKLPPVVWVLVIPIALIELVLSIAGGLGISATAGWRVEALGATAFSGANWDRMFELGAYSLRELARLVSYAFVQWGAVQALFVCVFTLALGKFVGEVYKAWAVLVVFFGAALFGALAYGLFTNAKTPLVGGYPATYGLIGAFTFILWTRLGAQGLNRSHAFILIGVLLVYQIVFGALGVLLSGSIDYYWVAELAGFGAGFLLSFLVSPGGWQRVLAKLRQP